MITFPVSSNKYIFYSTAIYYKTAMCTTKSVKYANVYPQFVDSVLDSSWSKNKPLYRKSCNSLHLKEVVNSCVYGKVGLSLSITMWFY